MKKILVVLALSLIAAVSAFAQASAPCECSPGHWYDQNRKSCVTGACKVPGMPDGDKGGGYFAWQGNLFINTPCAPCRNLDLTTATGQAGWSLVSSPGVTTPKAPVVTPTYPGWGTVPGASWVSVDAAGGGPSGDYTYEYKFCLCRSAKGMRLALTLLADNGATVWLNAKQIYATTGNTNFKNPPQTVQFTGAASDWIVPGTNTVRIVVKNETLVTGLAAKLNIVAEAGACPRAAAAAAPPSNQ